VFAIVPYYGPPTAPVLFSWYQIAGQVGRPIRASRITPPHGGWNATETARHRVGTWQSGLLPPFPSPICVTGAAVLLRPATADPASPDRPQQPAHVLQRQFLQNCLSNQAPCSSGIPGPQSGLRTTVHMQSAPASHRWL